MRWSAARRAPFLIQLLRTGADAIERWNEKEMCLTDMWRAAGSPPNQRPVDWRGLPGTKELLSVFEEERMVEKSHHSIRTTPGRDGTTWARVELAIDYLQYLNTHFRRWCLGIVRKYFQGGLQPKEDRG